MNKNYEAICKGEEIRANLIELKRICKDPEVAAGLLEGELDPAVIAALLGSDDAKIRKNAALYTHGLRRWTRSPTSIRKMLSWRA